ncbi:DDE-type integrase/transposase/recombinase [Streptomyces mirabilis]|uniref:DDE-type integrase/transposase/recombinase n=1 Tax=Streptomyces mirabilis TaxID=68239 RepID=UPI00369080AA
MAGRRIRADLLQRDFAAQEPNTKYVGDITYLPIGDGQFLYLAVLDLCSKRLTGRPTADHMRTSLVTDALRAAAKARGRNGLRGAIFHSDNGAQGGFNWSSQHFDLGGVRRGHGGLEFEDQRCSGGSASAVAR